MRLKKPYKYLLLLLSVILLSISILAIETLGSFFWSVKPIIFQRRWKMNLLLDNISKMEKNRVIKKMPSILIKNNHSTSKAKYYRSTKNIICYNHKLRISISCLIAVILLIFYIRNNMIIQHPILNNLTSLLLVKRRRTRKLQ